MIDLIASREKIMDAIGGIDVGHHGIYDIMSTARTKELEDDIDGVLAELVREIDTKAHINAYHAGELDGYDRAMRENGDQ